MNLKRVVMSEFSRIKDINIGDNNSWQNKIFLTFDIDWCGDEVLAYVLDILESYNIKATFFVTHKTKLLKRMRDNQNIELGIHPNFNFLLNGDFRQGKNAKEVIRHYKKYVEDAVSYRSHSLTQSGFIYPFFEEEGFVYDCNTFIPSCGAVLFPYKHTKQLIRVPHFFEDDVRELYDMDCNISKYMNYNGIKVFDFHPIHIFLNTEKIERYNDSKNYFNQLKKHTNNNTYGTQNFLTDLIEHELSK